MLVALIIAIIVALIKGYNPKYLFKTWTIYPFLCVEAIHVFFKITVFFDNYYFVQYAYALKQSYLYTLLIPMFYFSLYKSGLIGSAFILLGTFLNKFVMHMNGGKMPVYPSLSYLTGYVDRDNFSLASGIHMKGTSECSYKILSDWIDFGSSVMSIGDLLVMVYAFLIIYNTIKIMNKTYKLI